MVAFKINAQAHSLPAGGKPARSPRRRVLLSGMFHALTTSCPAGIRNLSCTGASIECHTVLKIGAEGVLHAAHLDRLCRVIWRKGNVYGVKFDQPLPNQLVLELHRVTEHDVKRAEVQAAKEWFQRVSR